MPAVRAIKWKKFIHHLRQLGFEGPFPGGKHQFMIKGDETFTIPNPHSKEIGPEYLLRLLKQLGISRAEWEQM